MPTLLKMELNDTGLFMKFTDKVVKLKKFNGGNIDAGLYILSDGFVYYYEGIYAFSGTDNIAREVIISERDKLGLVLIDTREVSKTNKQLIKKIGEFLKILYKVIGTITQEDEDLSNVFIMQDRHLAELKEELMIQHAV